MLITSIASILGGTALGAWLRRRLDRSQADRNYAEIAAQAWGRIDALEKRQDTLEEQAVTTRRRLRAIVVWARSLPTDILHGAPPELWEDEED